MKTAGFLLLVLLAVGCKNENTPKALKEVAVRKDGADGLIVSVALVDENGDPTSATGLLLVQVQGISAQDTVFTVTEMDTALTEASFRPLTFGAGSMEKKMLGFETGRILYQTATYRKTNKKGLLQVAFKPEGGPVLRQTVTYEL
ncbi:hypothetical protein [Larkinella arboricola]|uniref:Uncharacterized protein n=1 Tax=Larkinella arboricola TaxID=643671 RepID=A0A327WT74_LARAB|nr:hypothetical protein [Larkinella arboricola]RAJ94497.1 hypothetical protein LX87_04384 [Larkinella arboricola]